MVANITLDSGKILVNDQIKDFINHLTKAAFNQQEVFTKEFTSFRPRLILFIKGLEMESGVRTLLNNYKNSILKLINIGSTREEMINVLYEEKGMTPENVNSANAVKNDREALFAGMEDI